MLQRDKIIMVTIQPSSKVSFMKATVLSVAAMAAFSLSYGTGTVHASSRHVAAFGLGRREAITKATGAVVGGLSFLSPAFANELSFVPNEGSEENPMVQTAALGDFEQIAQTVVEEFEEGAPMAMPPSFSAYSITPDPSETLNPSLQSIDVSSS